MISTEDEGPVFLYTGRHTVPVRAFTVNQYLADPDPATEARTGLEPLLAAYPVASVLVYTRIARAAARRLTGGGAARLAPAGEFAGGAAYSVLGH